MNHARRIAVISDVHGDQHLLSRVLDHCQERHVESLLLLGDLVDRSDQVASCLRLLADWEFTGVLGNHERDVLTASNGAVSVPMDRLFDRMQDHFAIGDAVFVHDEMDWKSRISGLSPPDQRKKRIIFAGHTHYRMAKDEQGPIDLTLGKIRLRPDRYYLINPGAVAGGEFAIWDRSSSTVLFECV